MAGGTWLDQNKPLPGVYFRFRTTSAAALTVGTRGVAAACKPLSWGPVGVVTELEPNTDPTAATGYPALSPELQWLTEFWKGTNRTSGPIKLLLYRPATTGAAAAAATIGGLSVTALYPGARGNDITVAVTEDPDTVGGYLVSTIIDGEVVDTQAATTPAGLTDNAWVSFEAVDPGTIQATTGTALTGGADGAADASDYADFLTAIEPYKFDVLIYDGTDATVSGAMVAFARRMAEESGAYLQFVGANLTAPDSQYCINVVSGVTLADGTALAADQTVWWAGGATAGAAYNQSLTNASYPGAVSVSPLMTQSQRAEAVLDGKFVLHAEDGVARIVQDIDTLTTYTPDVGKVFSKNRIMRLCSTVANDIYAQFSANYLGVVNNNAEGRGQLKAAIVGYLYQIQGNNGIQNFDPDDVTVEPGIDSDAVVITVGLTVVDSVEKIYITVEVA